MLGGLLPAPDQFRDATTTFAAELRVALATQLRLARLAALSAELGISARPELRLARFSAFAAELRVTLGPELAFAGLAAAATDLSIKGRPVLACGRCSATLPRLTDRELSSGIHASNVGGQPSLACPSERDTDGDRARG